MQQQHYFRREQACQAEMVQSSTIKTAKSSCMNITLCSILLTANLLWSMHISSAAFHLITNSWDTSLTNSPVASLTSLTIAQFKVAHTTQCTPWSGNDNRTGKFPNSMVRLEQTLIKLIRWFPGYLEANQECHCCITCLALTSGAILNWHIADNSLVATEGGIAESTQTMLTLATAFGNLQGR